MNTSALIALGTNLPFEGASGPALLARAAAALNKAGLTVARLSSVWETEPWPPSDQPPFFNAVLEVDPGGRAPQDLYAVLREIEAAFGRRRREPWGPRTLDLDILTMGAACGDFDGIQIPHPRLRERAFVLAPLREIHPAWRCPATGEVISDLLAATPPEQKVRRLGPFPPF